MHPFYYHLLQMQFRSAFVALVLFEVELASLTGFLSMFIHFKLHVHYMVCEQDHIQL